MYNNRKSRRKQTEKYGGFLMITSIKDEATLKMLIDKLKNSDDVFICVLCGHTMSNYPSECPKCEFKIIKLKNKQEKLIWKRIKHIK